MDAQEEYKLKKLVRELKGMRGRHTELVTVYVPAGFDLNNIIGQIANEQGTASNIKSTATRNNVMDALEKCIQRLKLYKQTPPNGLALFCGNVSEREGMQDIKIWNLEPPVPISVRIYRCDQEFITEPLEKLVTPSDVYGFITIDNKNATIATLVGDNITIAKTMTNAYHGKHKAGGQSHRRFERIIEEQSHEFKKRIADHADQEFLPKIKNLRGIIVGGPASTKNDFIEGDYLNHELRKKIIAIKDITYTDEAGIRELIEASKDDLSDVEMVRQKTIMQQFMQKLVNDGAIAYGSDVETALTAGAVDTLLLSEKLDEDEIDRLYESAKLTGAKIEIVSDNFEEGFQLSNTFGKKAAILRFKIN